MTTSRIQFGAPMEAKPRHPVSSDPKNADLSPEDSTSERSGSTESDSGGLFHRPVRPLKPRQATDVPNRYLIKEDDEGRYLTCIEAPEIKVRIDRDLAVTGSTAKKAEEGTIYLDGAAQSAPFLDLERRVYNLDHHEGCVRPFTLSTCEQALVLVSRGLDLREKPWQIFANEPDLDTVIAIWVLLNSMHLGLADTAIREMVVPLVRLEGVIDSHGLELAELTGFSPDHLEETSRSLDRLREPELKHKRHGQWDRMEPLEFVGDQLQALDRMAYPADYFEAFRGIEELAKIELTENRIAVVCRCDCGIYELEKDLKRLYGKRLGVIVLQKAPRLYTLRQVDPFLPVNLERGYRKLNLLDPAVKGNEAADRWGGSAEIGGSPRKAGTDLNPNEIAGILRLVYRKPSFLERATSIGSAVAASGLPMLAGWFTVTAGDREQDSMSRALLGGQAEFLAAGLILSLILLVALGGRGRRRLYGLRWPEGHWWGLVAPAVMIGAVGGGVWAFGWSLARSEAGPGALTGWLCLLGFPLLAEILFRGLAHGLLMNSFTVQYSSGRWFVSWPVAVSALLYSAWTIPFASMSLPFVFWPGLTVFLVPVAALLCGFGLGIIRERSGSILSSLAVHWLAVATAILIARWLSA